MTKVGSVLGTAAYLSPEQARGEPAGPASDLYALGVVSYQLLAGRLPYEAASLTDLARQQDTRAPPPLHEVDPQIPRPLVARRRARARARPGRPLPRRRRDGAGAGRRDARDRAGADGGDARARRHRGDADARRHRGHDAARAHPAAPPRKRRMEPIAEPPRRAQAPRARRRGAPPRAPAAAQAAPRRRRCARSATLLILALLAGDRRRRLRAGRPSPGQRGVAAARAGRGQRRAGRRRDPGPDRGQHALSSVPSGAPAPGGAPARDADASARRPASIASRSAAISSCR